MRNKITLQNSQQNQKNKLLESNLQKIEKRQQIIEIQKEPEQSQQLQDDTIKIQVTNEKNQNPPIEQHQEEQKIESLSPQSDLSDIHDYACYAAHLFNQDEQRRKAAEQQMQKREEEHQRINQQIQSIQQQNRIRQQLQQAREEEEKERREQQIMAERIRQQQEEEEEKKINHESDQQEEEQEEEEEKKENNNTSQLPSRQLRLGLLDEIQSRQGYLIDQLQRFQSIQQQARLISTIVGPGNPETIRLLRSLDQLVLTFQTLSRLATVSQSGSLADIVLAATNFHFIDKSEWGLTEQEFETLPINIYGITNDSQGGFNAKMENSTKTACPICLDEYKEGDILRGLYCSHQFHEVCLKEWVKKKKECPLCKTKIIIQ